MACLKPHRRVDNAEVAWALRERLAADLSALGSDADPFWRFAETHQYIYDLFAHLTRGRKVDDPNEVEYCPAPIPPAHWLAEELVAADRFTLAHTVRRDLDV